MRLRGLAAGFAGVIMAGSALVATAPASGNGFFFDFSVTKENTGPASIVAGSGQKAEFTITVTYTESPPPPGAEMGVPSTTLDDYLPDGLVIDTLPQGCTSGGDTSFSCTVVFDEGDTERLVMTAVAPAELRPGTYTNCAWIQPPYDIGGEAVQNNCLLNAQPADEPAWTASATVEVTNDADLQLSATQPGQVDPGAAADITWTVQNAGPSAADAPLTLKSTLPAGVTYNSSTGPWECTATGQDVTCTYQQLLTAQPACGPTRADEIPCVNPVVMPSAEIPPVTWNVTTAKPGTVASYDVVAAVSSTTEDTKPANNKATAVINVTPVDLAVAKSAGSPVLVGDEATWTVSVSNAGTIDDTGTVTVKDTLPAGATFVGAEGSGWTCSAADGTVTCTAPGLAKGASSDIVIRTKMTSRGDATNKVTVATQSYEKNTANNTAQKAVRVNRVAQSATPLPSSPTRVKSGRTEQGQKLTTTVRCRPVKASAAGEASFCKVTRSNGVVRVKVRGDRPMKVTVVQTAKGTAKYKPFVQRKTYLVRP